MSLNDSLIRLAGQLAEAGYSADDVEARTDPIHGTTWEATVDGRVVLRNVTLLAVTDLKALIAMNPTRGEHG